MRGALPPRGVAAIVAAAVLAACGRGGLESPDPERRAAAVRALAADGGERDRPALLVAQRDPSPLVRRAAAEALLRRGGERDAEALATLLADADAEVVAIAARGLASMPPERRAKDGLLAAYAGATPAGRAAIADALERVGTSLRDAVEAEARRLWQRNLAAAESGPRPVRAGAIEELGASAREEAVRRLLPLVDPNRNPDPLIAAAAARGLGAAGDWAARAHLEALLGEPHAELAEAAAQALGALGDPAAADALAAAAVEGSSRLAGAAVEALAALPQAPDVGIALCEVAARTPDAAVAARAARQARAREAGCPERIYLSRLGRPEADPGALAALAELGLSGAAAEGAARRIAAMLEAARFDAVARPAAVAALGRLGWTGAAPALARRASAVANRIAEARTRWVAGRLAAAAASGFAGGSPESRLAAVVARDPVAPLVPATAAETAAPEWVDRVAAADVAELAALAVALGRLRADGAAALLASLSRDPLPAVRAGAVEGLAALGGDPGLAAATAALEDPAREVRIAGVRALPRFGPRAVEPLSEAAMAAGDDAEWRVELSRALADTGADEAAPGLAALLEGPAAPEAARGLARLGAAAGAEPLATLLEDPRAAARVDAIEALAQLAAPERAPAIAAQLTSDRPEVRAAAARALGRLRHEASSQRLEALRSDYYGRVRRAAVEALAKLPAGARSRKP